MDTEQLAIDFYNGAGALQVLSAWGRVMADPDAIREMGGKFEQAFTELSRLQDEGKIYIIVLFSRNQTYSGSSAFGIAPKHAMNSFQSSIRRFRLFVLRGRPGITA